MFHNLGSCEGSLLRHVIKILYIFGIVHPKMKIRYIHKFSSCSKLVLISSADIKDVLKNVVKCTMLIMKLVPIDFHSVFPPIMEVNGPCLVTDILQISYFFYQQRKTT